MAQRVFNNCLVQAMSSVCYGSRNNIWLHNAEDILNIVCLTTFTNQIKLLGEEKPHVLPYQYLNFVGLERVSILSLDFNRLFSYNINHCWTFWL